MKIEKLYDKIVKVVCVDGQIITGELSGHTSALDNEPNGESITVDTSDGFIIEIYVDEIASVEEA
ncbi:MAG: hypothetical protein ACOX0U_06405 [Oscillospiraceae bacterium]|jgi:hypothetical protein